MSGSQPIILRQLGLQRVASGQSAKIPIYFETDQEAVAAALASLAQAEVAKMKVVRILDTLNLERFLVSEGCLEAVAGEAREMEFDGAGELLGFCKEVCAGWRIFAGSSASEVSAFIYVSTAPTAPS